jgi:hypothetical protein
VDHVAAARQFCQEGHELGVVALAKKTGRDRAVGVDGQSTTKRVELSKEPVAALNLT